MKTKITLLFSLFISAVAVAQINVNGKELLELSACKDVDCATKMLSPKGYAGTPSGDATSFKKVSEKSGKKDIFRYRVQPNGISIGFSTFDKDGYEAILKELKDLGFKAESADATSTWSSISHKQTFTLASSDLTGEMQYMILLDNK